MNPTKVSAFVLTALRVFAVFILMTACQSVDREVLDRPDDLLSKEKMAAILTDIHLVEGGLSGDRMLGDTLKVDAYYKAIYLKYEIAESTYVESFNYYNFYPGQMEEVYRIVVENLSKMEAELEKELHQAELPVDSIDQSTMTR